MFQFAIQLLVLAILASLLFWVFAQLPIPEPIRRVIYIVLVVLVVLVLVGWLLQLAGGGFEFPAFPRR
jgi:hypothetical protein